MSDSDEGADRPEVVQDASAAATLLHLRTVVAVLFGSFGLVLPVVALTTTGTLVLAVVFALRVRTRPPLGTAVDTTVRRGYPHRDSHGQRT